MTSMAFLAVRVRCSRRPFTCADKTDQSAVESAWRTAPNSSAVFGGVTPYPCKTVLRDKPSLSGCTYASPLGHIQGGCGSAQPGADLPPAGRVAQGEGLLCRYAVVDDPTTDRVRFHHDGIKG